MTYLSSRGFLLACLFLLCFTTISFSAPVPFQEASSQIVRRDQIVLRSITTTQTLTKRDADQPHMNVLARRNIFSKIKHAFKKAFHAVGHAIAHVAKKIAHGVATAAKKVVHFVKTTGAKIAKFGLKILSTAQSIASKVVKFIPGLGTIASKALSAASTATNFISDKIHANLGKKLEKGMSIMNKIRNPVGGVAGKLLSAFR